MAKFEARVVPGLSHVAILTNKTAKSKIKIAGNLEKGKRLYCFRQYKTVQHRRGKMKKIISIFLCLMLAMSFCTFAFAADGEEAVEAAEPSAEILIVDEAAEAADEAVEEVEDVVEEVVDAEAPAEDEGSEEVQTIGTAPEEAGDAEEAEAPTEETAEEEAPKAGMPGPMKALIAGIGLLIMVYLLNYKERLFAIMRKLVNATCSTKRKARLYEFAGIVNETFIGFIVGRIIDSFIIGVLTFVVMKICAIPFALMISIIVGITNVIPFFGPFIGAIPSVFILMLEEPIDALYFIIIIIVIQQVDGNIIGPKIVGNAIGISSFWVLISVLIGGGLFGFPGMALGVPVFAVVYRYIDKITMASLRRKDKNVNTSYYFSLDPYGIKDDEVDLDPDPKKQSTVFDKFRKNKKDEDNKYINDQKDPVRDGNSQEIRRLIEREKNRE